MGKVSNAIIMLNLLNRGQKYSINELAQVLEVAPRMVRIYKEDLEKAGIYIDTIRGPYGGYVLNQKIIIPKIKFNEQDVELLTYLLNNTKEQKIYNQIYTLINKIKETVSTNKETLFLENETLEKYNTLSLAIKEKRKVTITYYSYNKGENSRTIHPYNMFLYDNGWGVAAFCETKKDLRHFELERIIKYQLLDEKY